MKTKVTLQYTESCLINDGVRNAMATQLKPEIERVRTAITQGYETEYASIHAPYDSAMAATIKQVVAQKQALKPSVLVVIGIGGSNLGTLAVHQALYGSLYNEHNPALKVYYADTVDTDNLSSIIDLVERELRVGNSIILNVISKSGATTETIANFELLLVLLKRYITVDYHNYVVVTTDKDSPLWQLAQHEHFTCLEIPRLVGGRYSVMTAVGLFPLAMIGIDIDQLLAGAQMAIQDSTRTDVMHNNAAMSAVILYAHYRNGIHIHDSFLFSVALEGVGKWYRQLTGESLGKEYNRAGKRVEVGITPTVSIGSTDLHSVAQLYLGGPRDKMTSFVAVEQNNHTLTVPQLPVYNTLVSSIQGVSFARIAQAIFEGTRIAYTKRNRPFVTWLLPEKNPFYLGQFLQAKMIEIIYLGFLLDVNPFDQPNVESYKQETRKMLVDE